MEQAGLSAEPSFSWHKIHRGLAGDSRSSLARVTEAILVGHKGTPPLRSWRDNGRYYPARPGLVLNYKRDEAVWHIPVPRDKRSRRHPTPKPPRLMERALLNYTAPGDTVLDPFMGGSPVGVASVNLGRKYIGIELDRKYFNLAVENIQRTMAERSLIQQVAGRAAQLMYLLPLENGSKGRFRHR